MEQRMRRNKLRWFKIEFLSCIFILTLATDGFCQASFTIFQQGALDKLYSYENITVKHYDISASIDMKKKSLKVHTKVLLKSKQENVKKLVFFLQSSIKINSIRHNNTQLRFGAKPFIPGIPYNIIRVFPNKPLAPGEEISLEFDCVGKNLEYEFQARDYLNKPIADFSRVLWYPLIFQEEFCTAHLTFHIPKGMTPVVDADLKQIMKGKNSTTYIYNTDQPIFSIGFMVGKFFTLKEEYNNIQCKVYYTIPAQKNIAKLFLSQSLKILSQYENWYGTYPFGIFQIVLFKAEITTPPSTNSRFIVITNPQEFLCNGNRELILTLAHEITHLWFPVQVSFKPKEGNWSEGIANDSAFMIWKKFCKRDYLKEMHEIAIGLRGDDRLEKPLKDVILPLTPIDIEVLYIKGAYFFQILRLIAGDSYFKIMRDFVEKYRYQFAGYSDIKSAFKGELGQNLDWFFEQWVETTKEFDFGIEKVDGIPAKDSFCFNIKNFGEIVMPLKGEVVIKTENKIINKEFNLDQEIQEICINIDSPLVSIQLDPGYWFYDINREDNIWSRGKPLFKKGLSQIKEGDIKSAYQSLNRALQLDIDLIKEGQFLEAIAEVHSLEGKTDEFLENLKSIRDSSPDDAELTKILQEQVSSINIWQEKKHLKQWAIIGPFDNPNNRCFDKVYAPELNTDLGKIYLGKEGKLIKWKIFYPEDEYGPILLDLLLKSPEESIAYASTYIYSPKTTNCQLHIGSDDGIKVWLNDKVVLQVNKVRGFSLDQDVVPATLKKGWNKVLLKVSNFKGLWRFSFRITDETGKALKHLDCSPLAR